MVARANMEIDLVLREMQEIKRAAQKIRTRWTPEQREHRAALARQKMAQLAPLLLSAAS